MDVKAHSSIFADSAYWLIQNQKTLVQQKVYATTYTQPIAPGNYKAYYVSFKNCLSDTASQEILVESVPVIPPMEDTLYTCEGKTLDLPVNTPTLYWSNSKQERVNGLATSEGQYTAHLQNTCAHVTDSLYVMNSTFALNNLITANGDGKNDCLYLESNNQKENFRLEIYNSWGNKVFEQNSLNHLWCPTNVSNGIYYYQLKYNQQDCIKKGWLEVVE
jgi:gliding motility-associated-like protein